MISFVLYLFLEWRETGSRSYAVTFFAAVIALTFFHPMTALLTYGILTVLAVTYVYVDGEHGHVERKARDVAITNVIGVGWIPFLTWYYSYPSIEGKTGSILAGLFAGAGTPQAAKYNEVVRETSPQFSDLANIAITRYGQFLVMAIAAVALAVHIGYRYLRGRKTNYSEVFVAAAFWLFMGLATVSLFHDVIINQDRITKYLALFGALTLGAVYLGLTRMESSKLRRSGYVAVYVAVAAITVFALLNLYPSPIIKKSNPQVTESEFEGMEWVLLNNDEVYMQEIGIEQYRFQDAILGFNSTHPRAKRYNISPPRSLGYGEDANWSYEDDRMLLVNTKGRKFYPTSYPEYREFWRYSPEDFNRLEADLKSSRIYSNGELTGYYVRTPPTG
ncbi:MAG: hypothetical protein ABEK59_05650 [Halobacteria archaeon]